MSWLNYACYDSSRVPKGAPLGECGADSINAGRHLGLLVIIWVTTAVLAGYDGV